MTTAYVLSGGASHGSIQVGMAIALEERGITPDLIVGTSVGAINGAWLAGGRPAVGLADLWHGLERADLFRGIRCWDCVRSPGGRPTSSPTRRFAPHCRDICRST